MISFGSKPRRSPLEYVQILTGYEDYFPEFFILDSWRVASVSTPQKPHRGCPRSLALGDRGDSGPQLAGRSPRSSRIGPGKRRCRQNGFWVYEKAPVYSLRAAAIRRRAAFVTTIEVVIPSKGLLLAMTYSDAPRLSIRPGAA